MMTEESVVQSRQFNLSDDDISFAHWVHQVITVKRGPRSGELYKTSKDAWRDHLNPEMASVYYIWRILSFRLGQDIGLPRYSDRYIEIRNDPSIQRLNSIVDYIGLNFFPREYSHYTAVCKNG